MTSVCPRMRMESFRVRVVHELIRIQNPWEFENAVDILGDTTFVGVCKPFPKVPKI